MTTASKIKSWMGPSPSDKYLPIWVVVVMFAAVWVLSAHMTSVIQDVCKIDNRCLAVSTVREGATAAEIVGSAVKQAAELQVAQAIAAAASAASAASEPKAR